MQKIVVVAPIDAELLVNPLLKDGWKVVKTEAFNIATTGCDTAHSSAALGSILIVLELDNP